MSVAYNLYSQIQILNKYSMDELHAIHREWAHSFKPKVQIAKEWFMTVEELELAVALAIKLGAR